MKTENSEPRMTPAEFEQEKEKLQSLSVKTVEVARLVFVEGMTNTAAAQQVGMSRQNVHQALRRVKAKLSGYPSDWVKLENTWMPESMAAEIRKRIAELKNE